MARSKKKAVSQRVVDVATTGLPSPVRRILGGRFVALFLVVTFIGLLVTGVISISWEDGRPSLSFNQERAKEVKEKAITKIKEIRGENSEKRFAFGLQKEETLGDKIAETVNELKAATEDNGSSRSPQRETEAPRQATRPYSRLKQFLQERR